MFPQQKVFCFVVRFHMRDTTPLTDYTKKKNTPAVRSKISSKLTPSIGWAPQVKRTRDKSIRDLTLSRPVYMDLTKDDCGVFQASTSIVSA